MKATLRWLMTSLFALLCLVALVGCGATVKEVIVYKTEYILVTPPDAFIAPTKSGVPPDPITYSKSSLLDREELLIDYANSQTTQLGMCNANKASLRAWKAEQIKLHADREKDKK